MAKLAVPLIVLLLSMLPSGIARSATLVTFDDLPQPPFTDSRVPIPNGYGGLTWQNFDYTDGRFGELVDSGYDRGAVSPFFTAHNAFGEPSALGGVVFDLSSFYLTAAWNDGLQVDVQGFLGTDLLYDDLFVIDTNAPVFIQLDYLGVDRVTFNSHGGTRAPRLEFDGEQFVMDNLTVNVAPEPAALALVGLALAGRLLRRR